MAKTKKASTNEKNKVPRRYKAPRRSDARAAELLEAGKAQRLSDAGAAVSALLERDEAALERDEAARFERETDPKPKADEVIERIYSVPHALALKLAALPLLRPRSTAESSGSSFCVIAADSDAAKAGELARGINGALVKFGASTGNAPTSTPIALSGDRVFGDLVLGLRAAGMSSAPAPDLVFIVFGDQGAGQPGSIGAMKESLALMRRGAPRQRILWVLTANTPPAIAKALNESKEEWIRSPFVGAVFNGEGVAETAWKAATVNNASEFGARFAAVPKTADASPNPDDPQNWMILNEVEPLRELMSHQQITSEVVQIFDRMKDQSLRRLADGTGWLVLQNHPMFADSQLAMSVHSLELGLLYLKRSLRPIVDAVPLDEKGLQQLEGELALTAHNLVAIAVAARHAHKRDAAHLAAAADLASKHAESGEDPRKTKTNSYVFDDQKRRWKIVSASAISTDKRAAPPPSEPPPKKRASRPRARGK